MPTLSFISHFPHTALQKPAPHRHACAWHHNVFELLSSLVPRPPRQEFPEDRKHSCLFCTDPLRRAAPGTLFNAWESKGWESKMLGNQEAGNRKPLTDQLDAAESSDGLCLFLTLPITCDKPTFAFLPSLSKPLGYQALFRSSGHIT